MLFLLKTQFLKLIGVKTQLLYSFGTSLVCNKILKVRNSSPTIDNRWYIITLEMKRYKKSLLSMETEQIGILRELDML